MEFNVFKIPKPDAIIFLNMPYEISRNLIVKKIIVRMLEVKNKIKLKKAKVIRKARIDRAWKWLKNIIIGSKLIV